jgi:hypothetical protein
MGYIKKQHRVMLEEMDNQNYMPNKWQDFVDKVAVGHNLIIKGKECVCTNCKHSFFSKKKIKGQEKCPNCKQTYILKRSNLKYYVFKDNLLFLDVVDNQFVARIFEICSSYNNSTKYYGFNTSIVEYARFIPNEYNAVFVNERTSKNQGGPYISHYALHRENKWRLWSRYYRLNNMAIVYPHNLKSLFKNTKYKYSMLWELLKHVGYTDIEELLRHSEYSTSIEMLTKMKLYNLALSVDKFYNAGNFETRFCLPKSFYPFMRRYNITYNELERLQILKEPNIKDVRLLLEYSTSHLQEVSKYIRIQDFIKYVKIKQSKIDISMYRDYLKFANLLGFDLRNKKYMFPKNLKAEHDSLEKQINIDNKRILNKAIVRRLEVLNKNTFKDKSYIIFPARSVRALESESKQQGHCVRTYSEDYATGKCDIYFLRELTNPSKSLVTIEVKENVVTQKRAKHNLDPDKKYLEIINTWEKTVLSKAS